MVNYETEPSILYRYLPKYTELDLFNDKCYISLVGFLFDKVKLKGLSVPFHRRFPEVNLRFYAKYKEGTNWKRGVVFIKEFVPKPAIVWTANSLFHEKYEIAKMNYNWSVSGKIISVQYQWKLNGFNNYIAADVLNQQQSITTGSAEEFIFEHYFGYSRANDLLTYEYAVEHPRWNVYPVSQYKIDCDFERCYGNDFAFLSKQQPVSVFLAEGSEIKVRNKRKLFSNHDKLL